MRRLKTGEFQDFAVAAREPWNASGCILEQGAQYRLDLVAITEPWIDGWISATPESGWPAWAALGNWLGQFRARARRLPMYALVGAVAREPATYFAALSPNAWMAPADGSFELFANDWASRYDNNRGRLALRLSRI